MDAAPEESARPTGEPIFDWSRRRLRDHLRLAVFVVLSVGAHAFFFYLFKVVYAPSERVLPRSSQVMLLHRSDPRTVTMLRDLEDRFAARGGAISSAVSGSLRLEDRSAIYEPSYSGHELSLERLELPRPSLDLPAGRDPAVPELPPVRSSRSRTPSGAGGDVASSGAPPREYVPATVVVVAGGSLVDRKLTRVPEADPATWAASGSGRAIFMVGVDRSGRVANRFPWERDGLPDVSAIGGFVGGLTFEPDEGAEALEWGTVEVRW